MSPPPPLPPPMWPSDTPISTVLLDQRQTEERSGYEESDWNSLVQYKWFWGYMSRGDCEIKLYNEGKIGDFVIRINSNGQLIMSLWLVYPCTHVCMSVCSYLECVCTHVCLCTCTRESVDSLCRDGADTHIVRVLRKVFLTRKHSKPFWAPSYSIPAFLYPTI